MPWAISETGHRHIDSVDDLMVGENFSEETPIIDYSLIMFQQTALATLASTDASMHKINEAIILGDVLATNPDVTAWIKYRKALRACVKAEKVSKLPKAPKYPEGI